VVLVATGSFCPVHKMHVRMFDIARAHLVSNGLVPPGPMCAWCPQFTNTVLYVITERGRRLLVAQPR
jgi:nicotinic acid mononucleotide adenylyltransferase